MVDTECGVELTKQGEIQSFLQPSKNKVPTAGYSTSDYYGTFVL